MRRPALPFLVLTACNSAPDPEPADDTDDDVVVLPDTATDTDIALDTDPPTRPSRPPCPTDGAADLSGWCNLSVNLADVTLPSEAGQALSLTLSGSNLEPPNPQGGYNNPAARGNRALAGLGQVGGTPLADLGDLEMDTKRLSAPPSLFLGLVLHVDLTCDGGPTAILLTSVEDWRPQPDGRAWTTHKLAYDRSVWFATQPIPDPRDDAPGTPPLVDNPDAPFAEPASIPGLLEAYPSACLRHGSSDDPTLPPGLIPGVMLSLGSHITSSDTAFWDIRRVTLADTTWGTP